ncbi:MAG: hypothetical protein ABI876_14880 [Bacteroidota bacterium]
MPIILSGSGVVVHLNLRVHDSSDRRRKIGSPILINFFFAIGQPREQLQQNVLYCRAVIPDSFRLLAPFTNPRSLMH